jgi:cation transporter-like permease
MRTTRPRYDQRNDPLGIGPQVGFAATTFAGFAAWSGLIVSVSTEMIMPILATMFLVSAAGFSVVAWRRRGEDPTRVTYADVAGALTLIGLFAASTIDPDQLVRAVMSERPAD